MYNFIEYSDVYLKTSGSLWQYYRDKQALDNNGNIIGFLANNNNSKSVKFKHQKAEQTRNNATKDVEIMVSLKYLSNFWKTLEILLIGCELVFSWDDWEILF